MKNKQSGPITAMGKEVISKNALKHGATSPKLIDEDEQGRYLSLVLALNNQYKSSNPLIQLQINRVARITVLLERIQNVIDAAFKRSRKRSNTAKRLIESLDQGNEILDLLAVGSFGADARKSRAVAAEILYATDLDLIKSNDDFIKKLPLLSTYLSEKSKSEGKSIKEFLLAEVSNISESHREFCAFIAEEDKFRENRTKKTNDQNIHNVDIRLLCLFASRHAKTLKGFLLGPESLISIEESISLEEQAVLPDGNEMDRLMRYQTTLQRQLSAAIGELLAIKKMDANF